MDVKYCIKDVFPWKNDSVIILFVQVFLIFTFTSCGYTILKTEIREKDETNSEVHINYFLKDPENMTDDEKLNVLCSTWKGLIVKSSFDKPIAIDTVFEFTINQDGTFVLDSQIGFFEGSWTFEVTPHNKSGFLLCLYSTFPEPLINWCHVGYFRHWGLQIYSHMKVNVFDFVWNLTRL